MDLLRSLFTSKKFIAALSGSIFTLVAKLGLDIDRETIAEIVTLFGLYIVGQGIADHGKERAIVESVANQEAKNAQNPFVQN